ncbi:universal stress protein [Halorhodospira halophila]|nr:universal stress protein [Halorhodospira halophila]
MSMQKVVFASDLSERAGRAGRRAVQLAEAHDAQLEAVHVIETDSPGLRALSGSPDREGVFQAAAEQQLQSGTPGHRAKPRVLIGDVVGEVVCATDEGDADLLVVGAHGRQYVRDWMLGTTAEQLVCHARTPTLVVRRDSDAPYRRVVVGVDFSECSRAALQIARRWFPAAELYLLYVVDTAELDRMRAAGIGDSYIQEQQTRWMEEARTELEEFARDEELSPDEVHLEVHAGYPATVLLEALGGLGADLVVMGNHGRGRWANMLLGSVASRLLRELSTDLLLVRDDAPGVEG